MLIKVINGVPELYTINKLKQENSNVSFKMPITDDVLAEFGVYRVKTQEFPSIDDLTQYAAIDDTPKLIDGQWTFVWNVFNKTPEQIEENKKEIGNMNRGTRNDLLSASDWTQLPDAPVDSSAWAAYRQSLRDITEHENFPLLNDSDWPVAP